jgi:hypothetical protein
MEQVWLEDKAWRDNHIRSGARYAHWALLAFALVWNGITVPLFLQFDEIIAKVEKEPVVLVAFLFPLVGVVLLVAAVKMFLAWRHFGPTPLVMDPFPGSIGGHVGGWVDTRIQFQASQRFDVTLSSLKSYVSGSGKNRKRSESVEWQTEGVCHTERTGEGTRLLFRFSVPEGMRETDMEKSGTYYLWKVSFDCELDGPDFSRSYEIPVFTTRALSTLADGTESHAATQDLAMDGLESVADIRPAAGGIEAFFPAFQRPAQGVFAVIFGMIFAGAGIGVGFAEDGGIVIPVSFFTVGSLIMLYGFWYLGKSLLVGVTGEGVRCRRFVYGYPVKTWQLLKADFQGFDINEGASMSSGNKTTVYYQLKAKGRDGETLTVGERMTSRPEVELLKETYETYLGG